MLYGFYRSLRNVYNYFADTHPREAQYKNQKWLAGWNPLYDGWIRGRATDELAQSNRDALGVTWDKIKNPWVASLAGGNEAYASGRALSTVSSNLAQHYVTDRMRSKRIRKKHQKRPYHTNKSWWMNRY